MSSRQLLSRGTVTGRIIRRLSSAVVLKVCFLAAFRPRRGAVGRATASAMASKRADCLTGLVT